VGLALNFTAYNTRNIGMEADGKWNGVPDASPNESNRMLRMRSRKCYRIASILGVNLFLLVVGTEAVSVIFFYLQNDTLFYLRPRSKTKTIEAEAPPESKLAKRLHPSLGLISTPGVPLATEGVGYLRRLYGVTDETPWMLIKTNNYGFYSSWDYPYRPVEDDTYIVVLLGGSVAKYLAVSSCNQLIEGLRDAGIAQDKKIVVLNMAQGGVKEPQQLQILTYFLSMGQRMDLVINIDGYNEVALGGNNHNVGIHASMPFSGYILPLVALMDVTTNDRKSLILWGEIARFKDYASRIGVWQDRMPLASAYSVLNIARYYCLSKVEKSATALEQRPLTEDSAFVSVDKATDTPLGENVYGSIAQQWAETSLMMSQILSGRNLTYVHVLQPNQYVSNHSFSPEEQRIALIPESPKAQFVRDGYPYLVDKIVYLRDNRVNIVNTVPIFDEDNGVVFGDSTCHLNHYGNMLLVKAITAFIAEIVP
jgi:hypothetical protein